MNSVRDIMKSRTRTCIKKHICVTDKEILISLCKAVGFCFIQQNSEENIYESISYKVKERRSDSTRGGQKRG